MPTRRTSKDQWQSLAREILTRLDIRSVYSELGVEITGQEPNTNGWLECRAFGRRDIDPSAGVNVGGEFPSRGRYKEFVGDGLNLSLFEFAAHCGRFPSWQAARDHYAGQAGVTLPKKMKHPTDSLEFRPYVPALVDSWTMKKPGISEAAFRLCGGRIANESGKHTVVTLPIFGEHGLDDEPCGWVSWNVTGKPLEVFQGKGLPAKSIKMKTASGSRSGWMGAHGLRILRDAEVVWVTEGPGDMLALVTVLSQLEPGELQRNAVICNSGGASEQPDEVLNSILAGKRVFFVPDCDEPGQKGCRRRAEAIAEIAQAVWFIRLPFEITPNHGKDLRDYFQTEGNSWGTFRKLAGDAEIITQKDAASPAIGGEGERTPDGECDPANRFVEAEIMRDIQLEVLGECENGAIKVFSEFHRKIDSIPGDVSRLSFERLLQLCGPPALANVTLSDDPIPDQHSLTSVRQAIAMLAGYRRVEERFAGIGCWQAVEETGERSNAVVLVGSREAAVLNGQPGLERVEKPRYGGQILDLSTTVRWYDFAELNEMVLKCDQEFMESAIADAEELFSQWRWADDGQSPKIIAGLVLATWVQTLWRWRPQVSIVGQSNSGKSTLFKCLEQMFGPLAITSSGSTAAGIRQAVASSAVVMLMDEFENSRHRKDILEMLRASGRGDQVFRGTTSQKRKEFTLRHIAWMAGIESGLTAEADKNRFIKLSLVAPAAKDYGKLQVPPDHELRHLGQRLLAVALKIVFEAQTVAESLRVKKFPDVNQRLVECYAVPAACYALAMGPDAGTPLEVLERMLALVEASEVVDDAGRLIQEILDTEVRLEKNEAESVAQVLQRRKVDPNKLYSLEAKGVAIVADEEIGEGFFISHNAVKKNLLKGTQWDSLNLDEILLRVAGAKKTKKRLAGRRPHGVLLPMSVLTEAGVTDAGVTEETAF